MTRCPDQTATSIGDRHEAEIQATLSERLGLGLGLCLDFLITAR